MDHVGKISGDEEFPYLLVIVDRATKWIEAFPCKTTPAEETAKILYEQWISRFSVPKIIHSDKGASFQSAVFREMCRLLGIQKINTTPLAPWSNGLAENAGRIVIKVVTRFVQENPLKWRQYLTSALFSYRTSVNASIGMSPYEAAFCLKPREPIDIHIGQSGRTGVGIVERIREGVTKI